MTANPIKAAAAMSAGRGTGGFTEADLASAYADGLSKTSYLLAQVMWWNDENQKYKLELAIYEHIRNLAIKHDWKSRPRGEEVLRKLARLAVHESTHPPKCQTCLGFCKVLSGATQKGAPLYIDCPDCFGYGRINMSGRARADHSGITLSHWQNTWGPRYEKDIHPWMKGRLNEAYMHVKNRMRDDD